MKDPYIRPLERRDLGRVAYLAEANSMFPADMLEDMTAPYFAGQTSDHRWLIHDVAGVDGVCYYIPEPLTQGTWNLLLIAVDPLVHGQGIGSKLMREVEAELSAAGQRILLVETSGTLGFARTRGFYEMLGYEREAYIRDYYAPGDDKVTFRKALA